MKAKAYELLSHTADIGVRVRGASRKELFVNAAQALFELIAEAKPAEKKIFRKFRIKQKASDTPELLVNWLNELLSLSAAKGIIFSKFRIEKLDGGCLQATATGSAVGNYRVNREVKAATYHQLRVEKAKSGWQAQVIFDV